MVLFIKINATFFRFFVHLKFSTCKRFQIPLKFLCYNFKCVYSFFLGAKNKFSVECLVTAWLFATLTLTSTFLLGQKVPPIIISISLGTPNAVGHQSNPHSSSHFVLNYFIIKLRV